ncbi:MAG: transporter substrate-binding domain-containing protein [Firmicutes bacterium]|nr:transporter substrate-binding domain-containing protein [Bacillota bacterium]
MKKLMSMVLVGAMLVCSMFMMTACGGSDNSNDMGYVQDKGVLVVGITDFAPMDYKDDNGEWIGFDADLAREFAESLGVDVEFVEIDWDQKEMELENKSIDVVWNGMTLTESVQKAMECSNAYCDNAQVVVLSKDVADKYQDADSIKDLTFAVEAGSAGADMVAEYGLDAVEVQTQANAVMEVQAGTADACIIDSLMAAAMVGEGTSYPNLTYTVKLNSEQYGAGFRKGSNLAQALNDFFVSKWDDGTMQEIAAKYGVQASLIPQE